MKTRHGNTLNWFLEFCHLVSSSHGFTSKRTEDLPLSFFLRTSFLLSFTFSYNFLFLFSFFPERSRSSSSASLVASAVGAASQTGASTPVMLTSTGAPGRDSLVMQRCGCTNVIHSLNHSWVAEKKQDIPASRLLRLDTYYQGQNTLYKHVSQLENI